MINKENIITEINNLIYEIEKERKNEDDNAINFAQFYLRELREIINNKY